MRWAGSPRFELRWLPRLLAAGCVLAICACSESNDGFDRVYAPPDGGAFDGSSGGDSGPGRPPPADRPDAFIEQPDDGDAGAAVGALPPYDVVGTRWQYLGTTTSDAFPNAEMSTRIQEVKETFTWPDGRDGAHHENTIVVAGTTMDGPISSFAIEDDRIVLEEVGGQGGGNLPALETVVPLTVGTRFGPRAESTAGEVTAIEEVTVPAGTYQALRVEAENPNFATSAIEWWAEGVGLVKAESVSPGPSPDTPVTTVIELEAFESP